MASMNHILTTPITICNSTYKFKGTFILKKIKVLMRKNGGSIVNFSTVASPLNLEGEAIYASTKCVIEKLTKICI